MISIVVVTYNQEHTIARTLDSLLCQQCDEPFEIVVGEDLSQDGTRAVLQDYAARHPDVIRLFLNDRNKGLVDNYFDCLLACRGELICDCAGDDYWCDSRKMQKQLDVMRAHPDVTLVHTAWQRRSGETGALSDGPALPFTAPLTDGREMLEAIITQTIVPVVHLCTSMYRKSVFLQAYEAHRHLFRDKQLRCEDLQLVFVMALSGRIAYLPDVTLHYTVSEGTLSNASDYDRRFRFTYSAAELSHTLSETFGIRSQRITQYFSLRVYELLMHALRNHDPAQRALALDSQRRWQAPDTWRTRLLKALTATSPTWHLALALRSAVRRIR